MLVELEGENVPGHRPINIRLILDGYDCQPTRGWADRHYADHIFLVTPPIPDEDVKDRAMRVNLGHALFPVIMILRNMCRFL